MAKTPPLGIRNNNPGNIDYQPGVKWQGLDNPATDGRRCRFKDAVYGIRAIAVTLITYQDKRTAKDGSRIDTVREIIERWAPPAENDTGSYVSHLRDLLDLDGAEYAGEVDVHQYRFMRPLVEGIIQHENGMQPYTSAQIDKALALAGVEPPRKALALTGTVKGGTASAAGVVGSGVTETLQDAAAQVSQLTPYLETAKWAFLALALAGVGYMLYRRWDDHRRLAR